MTPRVAATVAIVSLAVVCASAHDRPDQFGGGEGTITIPAASFVGLPTPDGDGFSNHFGAGPPYFPEVGHAPLSLPNGSEITQLCVVGYDNIWFGYVTLELVGWEFPRAGTTSPTQRRVVVTASSGSSPDTGMGTWCAPLPAPILVKSFGDLDANGVSGWTAYELRGTLFSGPHGGLVPDAGPVALGSAIVVWRRTVSPAPAVASFVDVPTTHPQFRFVQALVASGITGGCAADRFCPDASITRGQFGVFLSVALGLHYPN